MPAAKHAWWVAGLCWALAPCAGRADEFPYAAYVASAGAELLAGPGQRFYATERLAAGTKVEIYREEPSGWLAIRPPETAFSWVPAEAVERLPGDERLGRVKAATPAWIGTRLEQVREHRSEVTLKVGELVEILAEKEVASEGASARVWFKIAPPAGEFRWIHLRDVSRQPPPEEPPVDERGPEEPTSAKLTGKEPQAARQAAAAEPARLSAPASAIPLTDLAAPAAPRSTIQPAQFQSSVQTKRPLSPDGFVPRKRRTGEVPSAGAVSPPPATTLMRGQPGLPLADRRLASAAAPSGPGTTRGSLAPTAPAAGQIPAAGLERELEQIETDLALMVSQDKALWNLAALEARVERLVIAGDDPVSRGRARLLLDKIKQFEGAFDVAGYGPIVAGPAAVAPAAGAAASRGAAGQGASAALADPRYDAQGWLKPVISRKGDTPPAPYAVVDQEGQPICFVTPSPGFNLNRYLNKQVGLYGRRGYLEELKKPHVTAERVIDLERQWR